MTIPSARSMFVSFDGATSLETELQKPDKYRFFDQKNFERAIAQGAGLSYAAASFGRQDKTIGCSLFNRLLSDKNGILEVEAGTTLGQVYNYLIKHDRYLPVQPGHPDITVGGCVAADVHGKNQFRDGTFISLVEKLKLFHPRHGILELSRTQSPELFDLTCGGYGLTGIISSVSLRTRPIPSSLVEMNTISVPAIENLEAILNDAVAKYDLVYSWHDFSKRGRGFGRGFVKMAKFCSADRTNSATVDKGDKHPARTLFAKRRGNWHLNFFSPLRTVLFNDAFYRFNLLSTSTQKVALYDFLFPVHNKEIYFKLFGKRGFHECQFIIPVGKFNSWTGRLKEFLSREPIPVTLASGKLFAGNQRLLRFTGAGVCVALDFPRTDQSQKFVDFLHGLAVEFGAVPNIIKDSELSAKTVSAIYPEYDLFKSKLKQFDPGRIFRSELSERLEL